MVFFLKNMSTTSPQKPDVSINYPFLNMLSEYEDIFDISKMKEEAEDTSKMNMEVYRYGK